MIMKTVIFGKGRVGVATDLTLKTNADFHDPYKDCIVTDFSKYDQAFICVSSLVHGPFDHDAIQECLELLMEASFQGIVAIRCTVHPGFLAQWETMYPSLKMIHFPEFMKQRDDNYLDTPWVLVLGGNRKITVPFGNWLIDNGYGHEEQLLHCTLVESALIKLHQNAGLALKVTYANMMYHACQEYKADFETVRRGATADVRVGPAHTQVPGEDGFGFGGHCLPKDLMCLNVVASDYGFWDKILEVNEYMKAKNEQ